MFQPPSGGSPSSPLGANHLSALDPLRSILYVPAHRSDLVPKAIRSGAEAVCLVLEDSVPQDRKDEARRALGSALKSLAEHRMPALIKLNPLGQGLREDLLSIDSPPPFGVIVPQLESADQVREIDLLLAGSPIRMLLLIETPRAAVCALDLAQASNRVWALICAAAANGDMARATGIRATPGGLERLYLRSKILLEARAAGVGALDGVYARPADSEGLRAEATFCRQLGFDGKLCLTPAQVEGVNQVFRPSPEELARARVIVDAFEQALAAGSASLVVDGEFVDYAIAASAQQLLRGPDGAREPVP